MTEGTITASEFLRLTYIASSLAGDIQDTQGLHLDVNDMAYIDKHTLDRWIGAASIIAKDLRKMRDKIETMQTATKLRLILNAPELKEEEMLHEWLSKRLTPIIAEVEGK